VGAGLVDGKDEPGAARGGGEVRRPADERARRLAEAMRANLRRRKEQQRARREPGPEPRGDG
jgi:hypothetical protein